MASLCCHRERLFERLLERDDDLFLCRNEFHLVGGSLEQKPEEALSGENEMREGGSKGRC